MYRHRLIIQIAFFFLQNPLLKNFITGDIYQGNLKTLCTPGLNCHSCPAALTACPIGAIQLFLSGTNHSISLFVTGFFLVIGAIFGRLICGYVCPMGLLQDLLYKLKTPKMRPRFRFVRYIKYAILAVLVILLPALILNELTGLGDPWFCKYICPSGTIFGAIPLLTANEFLRDFAGTQLIIKIAIAAALLSIAIFVYRPFCRILCPLGAIYSLFNKIAFIKMHCNKEACTACGSCAKACQIKLNPAAEPNSPECVRCGDCISACKQKALHY
jgi:polyferredoxin